MSAADTSGGEILQAIKNVKDTNSKTNWILLGYVPKSDTKLKVVGEGEGGFSELTDQFNDGKSLFALVSFVINNTKKIAYISWCGEGVTGMKKGLFNNHVNDVAKVFGGFHTQINARSEADLDEQAIIARLTKASGASYDSGQKVQGNSKNVPSSVAQGREQATQSNVKAKTPIVNKQDYNKKDESAEYWEKDRTQEEQIKQQKATQPQGKSQDYQKTQEREKFWAEQQTNATKPAPQKIQPSGPQGGASSIKSKFENAAKPQEPPKAAPPPKKQMATPTPIAPPKHDAPPPPEPEPEPQEDAPPVPESPAPVMEEIVLEQEFEQQEPFVEPVVEPIDEPVSEPIPPEAQEEYPTESQYQEEPQVQEQSQFEEPTYQEQQYQEEQYQEQQYQEQFQEQQFGQARALYDYAGENPDDMSFKEGDVIAILDKSDPSGWWQGELNGTVGFFPSNFVEEI